MEVRLVAYEPDGARLGPVVDHAGWDSHHPQNDVSSLSVKIPAVYDVFSLATVQRELAVEVWNGSAWVEPRNGRFVSSEVSSDDVEELNVPSLTFRAYGSLLERAAVLAQSVNGTTGVVYDSDGKRNFLSATPGQIILSVLSEHRAKYSALPALTVDFTTSKDSAGAPWSAITTVAYSSDMTLLDVLGDLANYGYIDWWMEGRKLRVVNADSASVDRDIRLPLADVEAAPVRGTWDGMCTHVRVDGKDGRSWEKPVPGAPATWGARVYVIANDSITTDATAYRLIDQQIELSRGIRNEYTRTLAGDSQFSPFVDFQVGDRVWVKTQSGWEQQRVFEVGVTSDNDGVKIDLTLNDRFTDASVRTAKKIKGITHGASSVAGDGRVPSQVSGAVPAAPQGVTLDTLGYWSTEDGSAWSSVHASWAPVTSDIDGLAVSVDRYEMRAEGRTIVSTTTSAAMDAVQVGKRVSVQVRAVSSDGVAGEWSTAVEVVTVAPDEALDRPTAPTLSASNGVVQVVWDGKLVPSQGSAYVAPVRCSSVAVERSATENGTYVRIGRLLAGGYTDPLTDQVGQTFWYRLVALQPVGPESEPSAVASVKVSSAVSDAVAKAQSDAQDARNAAVGAQTTADGKNAIFVSASAPTAPAAGFAQGDNWYVLNSSGQVTDIKVWNGSSWVAYALVASSVIVPGSVGTVLIADGAVTGSKLTFDAAFIAKLQADAVIAGIVETEKFKTLASIAGDGVSIDRNGVVVTRSDGSSVTVTSDGVAVKNSAGTDLVRLGYGVATGMSIRNPRDGAYVPLTEAAFGTRTVYAENTTGNFIDNNVQHTDDHAWIFPFDSKYDLSVTFTTTASGVVLITVNARIWLSVSAADGGSASLGGGVAYELTGDGATTPVDVGYGANSYVRTLAPFQSGDIQPVDTTTQPMRMRRLVLSPNTTYELRTRRWKQSTTSTSSNVWTFTQFGARDTSVTVTTDGY